MARRLGEDAEGEAQDRIEAELSGEHEEGGGGSLGDGIDQPAMQREDRDLDREGDEERERGE